MNAAAGPAPPAAAPSPFDELAPRYDETFTRTAIGARMRAALLARLDRAFAPGARVLELGCGTGEDAVHLALRGVEVLATDPSEAMLDEARAKAARAGARVRFARLAAEELAAAGESFDGAFSSFGALNCVPDLAPVAAALAARLRPGAALLVVFMGPLVPWEWAWYLARFDPRRAFRRLAKGGVVWRGISVRYPSAREVAAAFAPGFRRVSLRALGALVPPSYAEGWAGRHPRLLAALDACERRLEAVPPLPLLADHYLLELARR